MATARDVVESALREIGVLAEGETATASQASEALTRLNRFIDRLATERLTIYTVTRTTFPIASNVQDYAVGPNLDVDIARPVFITEIGLQDTSISPRPEWLLTRFTEDAWAAVVNKVFPFAANYPTHFYYNPTFPSTLLTLWPCPLSTTLQGVVYAWTAVTQLSTLDTDVSLPPAYEEMLVTNLAMLLCPSYERQPNPVTVMAARDSMASLKRANRRDMDMSFEPAALCGQGSRYDITRG